MIAMFKAIPFGIFLSLLVSLFIGTSGSHGGQLVVFPFDITVAELGIDLTVYWSWRLFLGATALAFAILLMLD